MNALYTSLSRMRAAVLMAAVLSVVTLWSPPPAAALSSDEAARKIAERYDVEVLRVRAGVIDDTPVWFVTVMEPGGNTNNAFQVTTLAVDQESGDLVPAFRHGATGARLPEEEARGTRLEQRPEAMRSGTWR